MNNSRYDKIKETNVIFFNGSYYNTGTIFETFENQYDNFGDKIPRYIIFNQSLKLKGTWNFIFHIYKKNIENKIDGECVISIKEADIDKQIKNIYYARLAKTEEKKKYSELEKPESMILWIVYFLLLVISKIFIEYYFLWIIITIIFYFIRKDYLYQ